MAGQAKRDGEHVEDKTVRIKVFLLTVQLLNLTVETLSLTSFK